MLRIRAVVLGCSLGFGAFGATPPPDSPAPVTTPSAVTLTIQPNPNDAASPVGRLCWTSHDVSSAVAGVVTYPYSERGAIPGETLPRPVAPLAGAALERSAAAAVARVDAALTTGRDALRQLVGTLPSEIEAFNLRLSKALDATATASADHTGTAVERAARVTAAFNASIGSFEATPGFTDLEHHPDCRAV